MEWRCDKKCFAESSYFEDASFFSFFIERNTRKVSGKRVSLNAKEIILLHHTTWCNWRDNEGNGRREKCYFSDCREKLFHTLFIVYRGQSHGSVVRSLRRHDLRSYTRVRLRADRGTRCLVINVPFKTRDDNSFGDNEKKISGKEKNTISCSVRRVERIEVPKITN